MLYAIVAVIALIIDQAVKYWTTANIVLNTGEKALIPGFIHLTNIQNTGAAFSILEGARWFFVILTLVFVALIVYILLTDLISAPAARWAAVIVMAGAVGNCIDRLICGYVVDMLEFEGFMSWFPVFNVADIYITVGAVFFALFTLLEKPAAQPAAAKAEAGKAPAAKKPGFELPFGKKKTPIPEFPKREKAAAPAAPAMDPNDPFAEWERRAGEIKAANEAKGAEYVKPEPPKAQPAVSPDEVPAAPKAVRPAVSYPSVAAEPEVPKTPVQPAAAPVEAPAEPVAPVAPAAAAVSADDIDDFDFNIDDIMAEFKDL